MDKKVVICALATVFMHGIQAKHHHHHQRHHRHHPPSAPPEPQPVQIPALQAPQVAAPSPNEIKNMRQEAAKFALVYTAQAFSLREMFEQIPGTLQQSVDADELKTFTHSAMHLDPSNPRTDPIFLNVWQRNNPTLVTPSAHYIVPPIIHQVWVGPKSRERFEQLRQSWMAHHPGWLYKLWTDEDIKKLKLINQQHYDQARNPAHKADLLRYELLFMFGGVYADMDTQCVRSFDVLNRSYEFFVGLCDPGLIVNSLMGSVPGHPILRYCIETIKSDPYVDFCLLTGPTQLTKAFKEVAPSCNGRVAAFPGQYFNPPITKAMCSGATTLELNPVPEQYSPHEVFAIHGWAASWFNL